MFIEQISPAIDGQISMMFANPEKTYIFAFQTGPIVQWIERRFPKP